MCWTSRISALYNMQTPCPPTFKHRKTMRVLLISVRELQATRLAAWAEPLFLPCVALNEMNELVTCVANFGTQKVGRGRMVMLVPHENYSEHAYPWNWLLQVHNPAATLMVGFNLDTFGHYAQLRQLQGEPVPRTIREWMTGARARRPRPLIVIKRILIEHTVRLESDAEDVGTEHIET